MLMQSERALEGRLLDIEKSFDEPRKAPSVRFCNRVSLSQQLHQEMH
jgi:hypothetical protein